MYTPTLKPVSEHWISKSSKGFTVENQKNIQIYDNKIGRNETAITGVYCVKEISAPDGYDKAPDTYFFVDDNKLYVGNIEDNIVFTAEQIGFMNYNYTHELKNGVEYGNTDSEADVEKRTVKIADEKLKLFNFKKTDTLGNTLSGAKIMLVKLTDDGVNRLVGNNSESVVIKNGEDFVADTDYTKVMDIPENGSLKTDELSSGYYAIIETQAPAGYDASDENIINVFTIDNDNTIINGIKKPDTSETETVLSNTDIFVNENENNQGTFFATNKNDYNKTGVSDYFNNGYKVKKIEVLSTGSVYINYFKDENGAEKKDSFGSRMTVSGFADGKTVYSFEPALDQSEIKEVKFQVDAWGSANITGINVELEKINKGEQISIAGSGSKFTVNGSMVSLANSVLGAKLALTKTDENHNQLSTENAKDIDKLVISLTEYSGNSIANLTEGTTKRYNGTSAAYNEWSIGNAYTNSDIKLSIINNYYTNYYVYKIEETGTPAGYKTADPIYFYVVQSGGSFTFHVLDPAKAAKNDFKTASDYNNTDIITKDNQNGNVYTAEMVDVADKSSLKIIKKDNAKKSINEFDRNFVEGAVMSLTLDKAYTSLTDFSDAIVNGATFTVNESADCITWTTGKEVVSFENLPDGEYTLREVKTPAGYKSILPEKFTLINSQVTPIVDANHDINTTEEFVGKDNPFGAAIVYPEDSTNTIDAYDKITSLLIQKKTFGAKSNTSYDHIGNVELTLTSVDGDVDLSNVVIRSAFNNMGLIKSNPDISVHPDNNTVKWNTVDNSGCTVENLPDGEYIITETKTPDGYINDNVKIQITVSDGRIVKIINQNNIESAYTVDDNLTMTGMTNKKKPVVISKTDVTGTTEVAGAKIVITGELIDEYNDNHTVNLTNYNWNDIAAANGVNVHYQDGDTTKPDGIWWNSGSQAVEINDLPAGTYTLSETESDNADFNNKYKIVESAIEFTINSDNPDTKDINEYNTITVKSNSDIKSEADADSEDSYYIYNSTDSHKITIADAEKTSYTEVNVGKYDITGETEVEKATLTITDKGTTTDWSNVSIKDADDAEVSFEKIMDETDSEKQIGIKWVSGNSDVKITGLKNGNEYTLKETAGENSTFQSNGKTYTVITSELNFKIEDGKAVVEAQDSLATEANPKADNGYFLFDTDANTIKVCDAETSGTATISKQDATTGDNTEVPGAELKVIADQKLTDTQLGGITLTRKDPADNP